MIPKKIYLNYVNEDDDNKTWSETPVDVSDCKMMNREYTDLSQVWHESYQYLQNGEVYIPEPHKDEHVIVDCRRGYRVIYWGSLKTTSWKSYIEYHDVRRWAYVSALLPKIEEL